MDHTAKLEYLINLGFPDLDNIQDVLIDTQWDLDTAYWVLITDMAEQITSDNETEEVRSEIYIQTQMVESNNIFHLLQQNSGPGDENRDEKPKRKKTKRQMLELVRRYHNDIREAATSLVDGFMKIPIDNRSDEMMEKFEAAIETYRKRTQLLLAKDKKRYFRHRDNELDDTFANMDSHPSMFGTQEADEDMEDIDDLSQRFAVLSQTRASTQTDRPKHRGDYMKKDALNNPNLEESTRQKRLKRIRETLQIIANKNKLSLILLIGMVLKNETYLHDRQLSRIADCILSSRPLKFDISIQEAIYIRDRYKNTPLLISNRLSV